jgi:hypothetical protein
MNATMRAIPLRTAQDQRRSNALTIRGSVIRDQASGISDQASGISDQDQFSAAKP